MNRPPAAARWLLERVLPSGVAGATILGDLFEEFSERAETSPNDWKPWRLARPSPRPKLSSRLAANSGRLGRSQTTGS